LGRGGGERSGQRVVESVEEGDTQKKNEEFYQPLLVRA